MRKIWIVGLLIGITSLQYAATQFSSADAGIPILPGASKSMVLIDARVTDDKGNYVQGLQAEDFEIYQDGRLQEIASFHAIDRGDSDLDPRTIIFVVDDLGLSEAKLSQVRTALTRFAEDMMTEDDLAAIAHTSGGGFILQPLTPDSRKLQAAAEHWQWRRKTARPFENLALASWSSSTDFVRSCSGST